MDAMSSPHHSRKRGSHALASPPDNAAASPPKRPCPSGYLHKAYYSRVRYPNHPDCGLGHNFHSLNYPLTLMPYSSWHALHHRASERRPEYRFKCPLCRRDRAEPTAHRRKLFLVAERLSWAEGPVSRAERELNEELTWEVNYRLGLHEPAIKDPDLVLGGKHSRLNQWHPFADEDDCAATLKLVASADHLTQTSWTVWANLVGSLRESQSQSGPAYLDPPSFSGSKQNTLAYKSPYLPTPPSSLRFVMNDSSPPPASPPPPPRMRTLQEFYALLDSVERTSFVGAQFLEAYAEQLRDDLCNDCWFKHNILPGPPSP